ncbi:MAG: hypothetical protein ACKOXP_10575 [Flavobacteriales bacterium]
MNVKLGLTSALSASALGTLYTFVYYRLLFDFSAVLPIWKVTFGLISFTLLLFYAHFLFTKVFHKNPTFWFGITFSILTFASILYPMLERVYVDASEFYPGFAIPLHFLPILMFFSFYQLYHQK